MSEDQVFSEPILRDFERETEIRVRAVYDTEETQSTGVRKRLIAERDNAQADVYWANEPIRAEVLKQKEITQPYVSPNPEGIAANFRDPDGHWTGFSARARVLAVGTSVAAKPQSIRDHADARWRGRAAVANPLFGTTTTVTGVPLGLLLARPENPVAVLTTIAIRRYFAIRRKVQRCRSLNSVPEEDGPVQAWTATDQATDIELSQRLREWVARELPHRVRPVVLMRL